MNHPIINHPIEKLEDWQLAYIAGIIDGEGSVTLTREGMVVRPLIKVGMTSLECINFLHSTMGIGTLFVEPQYKGKHYKQVYRWSVGGRLDICLLLKALSPYLVVKRKHASLMLEFVERRIQDIHISGRDFELVTEMHGLNKKGIEEVVSKIPEQQTLKL